MDFAFKNNTITEIGDPHNGGKRVTLLSENQIYKPRSMLWEWLLLSEGSPLRVQMNKIAREENLSNPFDSFPELQFSSSDFNQNGKVNKVADLRNELIISKNSLLKFGEAIGVCCWLGISDLHCDNILFSLGREKIPLITPVDIEPIFNEVTLPSQTSLLPKKNTPLDRAGLYPLLINSYSFNEFDALNLISGFLSSIEFLDKYSQQFLISIRDYADVNSLTRVVLRATRDYVSFLNQSSPVIKWAEFSPELLEEEKLQLANGDVPVFYRKIGDTALLYQSESKGYKEVSLSSNYWDRFDILEPMIVDPNRSLILRRDTSNLKKIGSLQLLRVFGQKINQGVAETDGIKVIYENESIELEAKEFSCKCLR